MISTFENLPTEIVFEIFDYLTIYDIFHGFIRLNHRLNQVLSLYPLALDFQYITRRNFDFLCQSIHPKQIISLDLSEELMPDQVHLFQQYFPFFHKEFSSLKKLKFIDTSTILPVLPPNLSSLSIKTYLKTQQTDQLIIQILQNQNQYLTSLEIDGSYPFRSIQNSFPYLTHLTLDYCTVTEFHRILNQIQSPLIYLKIFFDKETNFLLPDFQSLINTLTNLILSFCDGRISNPSH